MGMSVGYVFCIRIYREGHLKYNTFQYKPLQLLLCFIVPFTDYRLCFWWPSLYEYTSLSLCRTIEKLPFKALKTFFNINKINTISSFCLYANYFAKRAKLHGTHLQNFNLISPRKCFLNGRKQENCGHQTHSQFFWRAKLHPYPLSQSINMRLHHSSPGVHTEREGRRRRRRVQRGKFWEGGREMIGDGNCEFGMRKKGRRKSSPA